MRCQQWKRPVVGAPGVGREDALDTRERVRWGEEEGCGAGDTGRRGERLREHSNASSSDVLAVERSLLEAEQAWTRRVLVEEPRSLALCLASTSPPLHPGTAAQLRRVTMAESPNVPTEYPDGDHGDSPLTAADPPWDPLAAPHLGAQSPLIQASDDDDQDNYDDGLVSDPLPPQQPQSAADPSPAPPPPPASASRPPSLPPKPSAAQPPPSHPLPPRPAAPHPESKHLPDGLAYNPALHPPKRDLPVPDRIPGEPVLDGDKHWTLKKHLAELCGTHGTARCVFSSLWASTFAT